MEIVVLALVFLGSLSGCAIVPAYGPPAVYAPAVIVPYGGYYYGGGHGHRHGHGHRGYR